MRKLQIRRVFLATVSALCIYAFQPCLASQQSLIPVVVLREGLDAGINEWSGPAKFVLYKDGTVIVDVSQELDDQNLTAPDYRIMRISEPAEHSLLASLTPPKGVSTAGGDFGAGVGQNNEGITWQVIYWPAGREVKFTNVGSLSSAPSWFQNDVHSMENYTASSHAYLSYNCKVYFAPGRGTKSIPWPVGRSFLANAFASHWRYLREVEYVAILDAASAHELDSSMRKQGAKSVIVNRLPWLVQLSYEPRLPGDSLWIHDGP